MTPEDSEALLARIRANQDKLDACPKHLFDLGEPPYSIGQRHTCLNCGGVEKLTAIGDYVRGYIAAGGNPNDIVPNWS